MNDLFKNERFLQVLQYVAPIAIILLSLVLGIFAEKRLLKKLKVLTSRTAWIGDDLIVDALKYVITLWFVIVGIYLATNTLPLNAGLLLLTRRTLLAIFLSSITLIIAQMAVGLIRISSSNDSPTLTTLFETITKLLIYVLGVLVILQSIGIAITPLLTAFGVGGVSLGLAFQGTLTNLLSGINIITSKKVRPGDYIKMPSGEEGYVVDVELKYTVIKTITNNLVVIPNAQLLAGSFTNYGLPEKQMLLPVKVGISYDSDLEQVEKITLAVAQETLQEVPGGVKAHEVFMRYDNYDYYSINFFVYLAVEEYFDQLIVKHEFLKRLHKRYQEESIKIAFPIQNNFQNSENTIFNPKDN